MPEKIAFIHFLCICAKPVCHDFKKAVKPSAGKTAGMFGANFIKLDSTLQTPDLLRCPTDVPFDEKVFPEK